MKIMVPLAEGFEEIEAITIIDVLRRAGIEVITTTLDNKKVNGAHDITIETDKNIKQIKIDSLDGIVLPGGMPGAANLRNSKELIEMIRKLFAGNKLTAAICAAPIVLEEAGVLEKASLTSYPDYEKEFTSSDYKYDRLVADGNIITGRGPGVALEFAITLVKYLLDEDTADKLKEAMITNF